MSLRVVVVEDETLTRIDLIEILKENGYDVVGEILKYLIFLD